MREKCSHPGILSHSSSVNLPSYSTEWWTKPAELELVWLLFFERLHSFGLSNISDVLWRYVPEKKQNQQTKNKRRAQISLNERRNGLFYRSISNGPHLGYCSLRRTLSYPRSSWQSLYWEQWQNRPLSVCWSSGSLLVHLLCHLKTQLLSLDDVGHQTLATNTDSSECSTKNKCSWFLIWFDLIFLKL